MKNGNRINVIILFCLIALLTAGCGGRKDRPEFNEQKTVERLEGDAEVDVERDEGRTEEKQEISAEEDEGAAVDSEAADSREDSHKPEQYKITEDEGQKLSGETGSSKVIENYDKFFSGLKGCAVIYDKKENAYHYYNEQSCNIRVSPCSTFKIVTTLIGLKNGVLESKDTLMGYDGMEYETAAWNADLRLEEAFQTSCIWYFRKVIDHVGKKEVLRELDLLKYGNCDISEWEGGSLNGGLPQLNGFWLESSLKISPKEQVDVLESIFEGKTEYSEDDVKIVRDIMKTDAKEGISVFGKTGTGIRGNAWFAGFFEKDDSRYYFAVHLDDKDQENMTGADAKRIALKIITKEYFKNQ